MVMNHTKYAWVAVISFALAMTIIGVGKPAAGGDNGKIEGIGELIIKGFGAIEFPGSDWNLASKSQKKGGSAYKCDNDEGCHFYVQIEGSFCNGTANPTGSADDCSERLVEVPQGVFLPGPQPIGTFVGFHCENDAVVYTFNDLLWVPELCYPEIDS